MRDLWAAWPHISSRLKQSKRRLLLFDVDGTLSPIVKHPFQAKIPNDIRKILKDLSSERNTIVGIISGRSLKATKRMVRIGGIVYAGNHGLEIETRRKTFVHPFAKQTSVLLNLVYNHLLKGFNHVRGLVAENNERRYRFSRGHISFDFRHKATATTDLGTGSQGATIPPLNNTKNVLTQVRDPEQIHF